MTPRWSASCQRAQAIRGRAAKSEPSTAVSPFERLGLATGRQRDGLGGQFLDDRPQPRGVEDARGFGERTQGGPLDAELLTGLLPPGGLLQGAEALQGGVAEVHQQEGDVLVVEELPIAGAVAFRADVVQSGHRLQQWLDQPLSLKERRWSLRSILAFGVVDLPF